MIFIGLFLLGFTTIGVIGSFNTAWLVPLYRGFIPMGGFYSILQSIGALDF